MFACSYAVTVLRSYDKVVAAMKGVAAIKEVEAAAGEVVAAGGGKIQPFLKKRAKPREIG